MSRNAKPRAIVEEALSRQGCGAGLAIRCASETHQNCLQDLRAMYRSYNLKITDRGRDDLANIGGVRHTTKSITNLTVLSYWLQLWLSVLGRVFVCLIE
jgi:hypothetical protein